MRTTFKLPEHIIKLLGIVARQLGLKQKPLFNQLVENTDVLNKVAATIQTTSLGQGKRRQKTFILSKRSLEVLDSVAGLQNIPRDVLVEISIRRLLPIITAEQEKDSGASGDGNLQRLLQKIITKNGNPSWQ